jgi:RHS repeat-associated protein
MITYTMIAIPNKLKRSIQFCSLMILLLGWSISEIRAQVQPITPFTGSTPLGLEPGAPAGSFPLSGFDQVNLFNGSLHFNLPLLKIGGRGIHHTISRSIEQHWYAVRIPDTCQSEGCGGEPKFQVDDYYDTWWTNVKSSYGTPSVQFRSVGTPGPAWCPGVRNILTITRATLIMPDGTEHEMRDQLTGGKPLTAPDCADRGGLRGRVWTTTDGTSATFISSIDIYDDHILQSSRGGLSGDLYLRDGTRYHLGGGGGIWMQDRNGNRITFYTGPKWFSDGTETLDITRIVDPLGREVNISYANFTTVLEDRISYYGFGKAPRTIRVGYARLDQVLRPDYSIKTRQQLFPELYRNYSNFFPPYTPFRVAFVEMPDGRRYRFFYNEYGELARVELPTGGAYEYDWTPGSGEVDWFSDFPSIHRRVIKRRVYPNGGAGGAFEREEVYTAESFGEGNQGGTIVQVDRVKPGNVLITREKHYFHGNILNNLTHGPFSFTPWKTGRELKTETFAADGVTLLRRAERNWQQRAPVSWWSQHPVTTCTSQDCAPQNDPRIVETTTTFSDITPNLVTKSAFSYDQYNNLTEVTEHGFGAGAPGPPIRRTRTTYLTNNGYQGNVNYAAELNIHIRNLPQEVRTFDGNGNLVSLTYLDYDRYDPYPLRDCPGIVQHDGAFNTGYGRRGNLTLRTKFASINPGNNPANPIYTHNQYDIAGNVVKTVNGRGVAIDFDFSDRFELEPDDEARSNDGAPELGGGSTYAFPTKITNALDHTAYAQYDYYLGRAVNSEDINGFISSVVYNDALDRPTQGIQARYKVGGGIPVERKQTTFTYNDADRVIITTSDRNTFGDNLLASKSYYDGLGRTWRAASDEGVTWSITDTRFDAMGKISQISNPYRAADPDSASPPAGLWTKTAYDSLGRVFDVEAPDGSHITTLYSGNQMTVIDQAGKSRRSETDPLGRLIRVTEAPGVLNYVTTYLYDPMNNLRHVRQGQQERWYSYDGLSRMIRVRNPEQDCNPNLPSHTDPFTGGNCWSTAFKYDENGNLTEKTDARGVKTAMTYDALNRVTSKVYAGTNPESIAAANATPSVNNFYDDYSAVAHLSGAPSWPGTPSKGRPIGVTYGVGSEGTYHKYDALGGVLTNHQRQGNTNYVTNYTYNRAGAVTREERMAGSQARRRIVLTYDEAGRLSFMDTSVFSGVGSDFSRLVGDISYTPSGALQSEKYGNGLIHSMSYNNRLQPTEIRLGRQDNLESVFRLNYIYGTASNVNVQDPEIEIAGNNGNIARIKYFISGALQYSQTFLYDGVNRLGYAVEHNNGVYNDASRAWYQKFDYDIWGNRGIDVDNTSDNADAANSALQLADFSAANNRITRAGFAYDANGNLTDEPEKEYFYDAENRLYRATVAGVVTSQNFYDGTGRRVRKVAGGMATRFVYGAGGELIEERNDSSIVTKDYFYRGGELLATTKEGGGYEYATADHLGSPRAWTTGKGGTLTSLRRRDYMAFGAGLFAGVGTRTTDQGYVASEQQDGQRKGFGAYEKDSETGLSFAGARYFASLHGRFTTIDPAMGSIRITNPQSFNRYTYALNNPLRYVDPDGQVPVETVIDVLSLAHSFYKLYKEPSWENAGYFIWDAAATLLPYVPGSWSAKALRRGVQLSREAVEWSAKIGRFGYRGLEAQGIVKPLENALEIAVNNDLIRKGVGLLSQGDRATRLLLHMGSIKAADFVGATPSGTWVISEAKGTHTDDAVTQIKNTAEALVNRLDNGMNGSGNAQIYAEIVMEEGKWPEGPYGVSGSSLVKFDEMGNSSPVTITVGEGTARRTIPVQVRFIKPCPYEPNCTSEQ